MGKKITISENERLNIKGLYSSLLNEQEFRDGPIQKPEPELPKKEVPVKKYLPIADEFCQVLGGTGQLKRGAKGDLIKLFQEALNACGIEPLQQLVVDGDFGSKTKDAVELFQEKNGLQVDGAIGPETSDKLCELGCIPKEICDKCKKGGEVVGPIKDGGINVDCEKVQACISKFMGGLKEDFCIDEDKIKGLLQCVGIGQCFEGGKVPPSDMIKKPFPSDKTFDV